MKDATCSFQALQSRRGTEPETNGVMSWGGGAWGMDIPGEIQRMACSPPGREGVSQHKGRLQGVKVLRCPTFTPPGPPGFPPTSLHAGTGVMVRVMPFLPGPLSRGLGLGLIPQAWLPGGRLPQCPRPP